MFRRSFLSLLPAFALAPIIAKRVALEQGSGEGAALYGEGGELIRLEPYQRFAVQWYDLKSRHARATNGQESGLVQ